MNFKYQRLLSIFFNFLVGAFFCLIGFVGLILPWSRSLKLALTNLIFNHSLILSLFGLSIALVGASIMVFAIYNCRRKTVSIKFGKYPVTIEEDVVEQYLAAYWQKKFPSKTVPFYFSIRKKSLKVVASLPYTAEGQQDKLLMEIEHDFVNIFDKLLGFQHEIHFVANFQQNSTK